MKTKITSLLLALFLLINPTLGISCPWDSCGSSGGSSGGTTNYDQVNNGDWTFNGDVNWMGLEERINFYFDGTTINGYIDGDDGGADVLIVGGPNSQTLAIRSSSGKTLNLTHNDTDGVISASSGFLKIGGLLYLQNSTLTIASDGAGTAATTTLTPAFSYRQINCQDTDGCNITMGETGMVSGTLLVLTNTSTNVCNFSDTSNVSNLNGAYAMAQNQTLFLLYANSQWVELARSAN